jgi:hypothetical protein
VTLVCGSVATPPCHIIWLPCATSSCCFASTLFCYYAVIILGCSAVTWLCLLDFMSSCFFAVTSSCHLPITLSHHPAVVLWHLLDVHFIRLSCCHVACCHVACCHVACCCHVIAPAGFHGCSFPIFLFILSDLDVLFFFM